MMPALSVYTPMVVTGIAAAGANAAAKGILPHDWSLPLTCLAGSCLGGVLAVIMTPPSEVRTVRGEGIRWLGATITATTIGPAACQMLPVVTVDNVLFASAMLGFLAWPLMAVVHRFGPERLRNWLETKTAGKG